MAKAKAEGYRSRAAYKLLEIDDKYRLLKPGMTVVDLGAAPGGWSQIAAKRVGAADDKGRVVAIDLLEMPEIPGVSFAQLDFLADDAPEKLIAMMGGRADVVLSDMAANTTGHRKTDQLRMVGLVETAAAFAADVLTPGGTLCRKGVPERRRCRAGGAVETGFCQRAPCQAGLEPPGFVGALCAGDGVSGAGASDSQGHGPLVGSGYCKRAGRKNRSCRRAWQ